MQKNYMVLPDKIGYIILIVCIISVVISSAALYEIKKITGPGQGTTGQGITIDQFLAKLTAHNELTSYRDIPPLNIIQVNNANLANLQAQINGLDASFIGSYIVQYTDRLIIYNLETDQITTNIQLQAQQQQQMPQDFFAKLLQHPELQGVGQTQPQGGILDQASLASLKQQLPDVYKDAQVGDYLLRYVDRLIIYNYQQDRIVNAVALQQ